MTFPEKADLIFAVLEAIKHRWAIRIIDGGERGVEIQASNLRESRSCCQEDRQDLLDFLRGLK